MSVIFNDFANLSKKMHKALSRTVRKTALDVAARAATNAPVDTGFLRNSVYTVTSTKSTYGRGVQVAKAPKDSKRGFVSRRRLQNYVKRRERQRAQEAMLLSQIPPPPTDLIAYVAVGASYGIYVELGTKHMPARPYFYPAVDAARSSFQDVARQIENMMKADGS